MKRIRKCFISLSLVLCLLSQLLLTGCYRSDFIYDQDKTNIKSIEIVDAPYALGGKDISPTHTLVNVDDIDYFLNQLEKLTYKSYLFSDLLGLKSRVLGIKITYNNDNFEIFTDNAKESYTYEKGYSPRAFGFFDSEEFYALLYSYLNEIENCHYNFMHDTIEISSIEIVKSVIQGDGLIVCETLATIENENDFIDKLNAIDYVYTNEDIENEMYHGKDQPFAVKIVYTNGDSEVFSHNHRDEIIAVSDQSVITVSGSYIGTFDEVSFYNLLSIYMTNY